MAGKDLAALTHVFEHETEKHRFSIHWTSLGPDTAPPLILVHGTPWSSRLWSPYAKALSSRFKVYLFDNPGYGLTPGAQAKDQSPSTSASLATQAEAFAALYHDCWKLGTKDQIPHVIAHDNGGIITLRAHLLHNCAYASLCLIDVVALRPYGSPLFRLIANNQDVFNAIPDTIFEGVVRAYINEGKHKPLPSGIEDMLVAPWIKGGSQGQEAFIRQMIQADEKDVEELDGRYGEVGRNMPVKIIWGTEDFWIPVDRADKLGGLIGAKEVVKVEEAGHLIMYDQPARLAMEIALWLADVNALGRKS